MYIELLFLHNIMYPARYIIIVDHGIGAPRHYREIFNGFNTNYKRFLSMLMKTVQLTGVVAYDTHMAMHTSILQGNFKNIFWTHHVKIT